jgi:hypothetical protein
MTKCPTFTPTDKENPSWVELSRRLGFSRTAIYKWRTLPDAPKEPDAVQWQAFIEDHGLGKRDTRSLTEIKADVENERLRKLRRENEVAEGEIVNVVDMANMLKELAAKFDLVLTHKLDTELPPLLVGQPIAEVRAICAKCHDEIREITDSGLLDWTTKANAG